MIILVISKTWMTECGPWKRKSIVQRTSIIEREGERERERERERKSIQAYVK